MAFYIKDSINFVSGLTPRRIFNAKKVLASYHISSWKGKAVHWGMPITISVEPTTACNLRCPECPSGLRSFTRPTGNLKTNLFIKTIDEIHKDLIYLIFYFQGEPYINPNFLEMAKYATDKGIYTITSTNGHFLDKENAKKTVASGLNRVIISVDGTTQDVYESYRISGQLDVVLQGAQNLVDAKKAAKSSTPHIVFQFLVTKPNEHQIDDIQRLADKIGVDEVKYKTVQVYDYENGNDLIPTNEKYSRYTKLKNGKYKLKASMVNNCWKLWHSTVVTFDGQLIPCCFDKDADHPFGSISETASFRSIWEGKKADTFRCSLTKSRSSIDICTNCTEGSKVWL